ncbi:MAG: thiamine pyrophosphate-binding protein [Deltaproteobacteria bacterium]|nr:thiamine pyrophosphate-binding protein [Deltaproteobacteria bacterium]
MKISGARFVAETLKGYGITHVFYVEAILRRALVEMEALGIERILTHSEKAAAYMADGYARVSRRPGICMAQSVGAANLASGLQDPFPRLSPVIAITGRKPPIAQHRNAYQEILHSKMFEPVTKLTACVETVEQLPHLLRQAFREAVSSAPGPVHLDFLGYEGELTDLSEAPIEVLVEDRFRQYPPFRPEPEPGSVREASEILKAAKRPVIVAGGGAAVSAAGPEVIELAETLCIPVATSLNGKGIIPENHRLAVGVVGSYSQWCANRVVYESDLVLFVGSRTGDQVTNNWTIPGKATKVIQIDVDPTELGRNYPNVVSLAGDAKAILRVMGEYCYMPSPHRTAWSEYAHGLVEQWNAEFFPLRLSDAVPIRVERLCEDLTRTLPPNGILVSDTGYAGIWTGAMVRLHDKGQSYIRAAGSLGWGFPAALGAKCAAPSRPVICFIGDGGFYYHLSELETALRRHINVVVIVNNNSCFRQCLEGINHAYGARAGAKEAMYKFIPTNFFKIAKDFGCEGIRVEEPSHIIPSLKRALTSDRTTVIDVVTDEGCRPPSPWMPE